MWGAYLELDHNNKELTRRLLERAAAAGPDADPVTRLAGDFYAAGMDEAAIAAAGAEPLRPFLDRVDAVGSIDDLRALNLDLHRDGAGALFGIGVESDFEDAAVHLAYLGQAGLGLPERSYYLNDDERSVGLRTAYTAHVAAQLRNLGAEEGLAAASADAILAFERRLAEASLSPEQRRDPKLTLNRVRGRGARRRHAGLPARRVPPRRRRHQRHGQHRQRGVLHGPRRGAGRHAGRHAPRRPALASGPVGRVLPRAGLRRGELRVLRADPRRPAGPAAALEARRGGGLRRRRRGGRAAVRARDVPARGEGPGGDAGRAPAVRDGPGDPRQHLDDRRHARGGPPEARGVRVQDRVPGSVAGLLGPHRRSRAATSRAGSRPPRSRCAASSRSSARPSTSTSGRCPRTS